MIQRSPNQTFSPHKNPKKINHPLICSSSPFAKKYLPSNFQEIGILQAPPPLLSHSVYPPFSLLPPPQPPLLPLPAATRGLSCPPPTNRKTGNNNRTRDPSLTPKRPNSYRKENKFSPHKPSDRVIISSTTPLGPDPNRLPMTVAKAFPLNISPGKIISDYYNNVEANISDKFSGSVVFAISPPPSSLPLPRFSLRPKLSCKVEAAGIDTGATDDLRRLLRLL